LHDLGVLDAIRIAIGKGFGAHGGGGGRRRGRLRKR